MKLSSVHVLSLTLAWACSADPSPPGDGTSEEATATDAAKADPTEGAEPAAEEGVSDKQDDPAASCNLPAVPVSGELQALWSQVVAPGQGHTVEARWVLQGTGKTCADWTMNQGPDSVPGVERVPDPRPAGFDITVCAAALPDDWQSAELVNSGTNHGAVGAWGGALSAAAASRPVINLGDTGCRGYSDKNKTCDQRCDDSDWGFGGVLSDAATKKPALYVHVGDYRYRGEDDKAPDSWDFWYEDFFVTVNESGRGAPWVLARGNHELCPPKTPSNGPGWWLLLGPDARTTCSPAADPTAPALAQTWHVDMPVGTATHRFTVVDTSDPKDSELQGRFTDAISNPTDSGYTRWVHHHPILALLTYQDKDKPGDPDACEHHDGATTPGDCHARAAFAQALGAVQMSAPAGPEPLCNAGRCVPQTDIVGHEHFYEHVQYRDGADPADVWPETLVVGHGGVILRESGTEEDVCDTTLTISPAGSTPEKWSVEIRSAKDSESKKAFGYVAGTLASDQTSVDGWTLEPVFTGADKPTFTGKATSCTTSKGSIAWETSVAANGSLGFPAQQ